MQSLDLPEPVGAVTCLFDALNYLLDEHDLGETFDRVREALRPGGLFIFDMNTASGLERRWAPQTSVRSVRRSAIELNAYEVDVARCLYTVRTTTYVREATGAEFQRYEEVHRERAYPVTVIRALLERAGLVVEAAYSLYDRFQGPAGLQPFSEAAGRMMLVARRSTAASTEDLPAAA
jgi:hypothetical protein